MRTTKRFYTVILGFFLLSWPLHLTGIHSGDFSEEIDDHARSAPFSVGRNLKKLTEYLVEPAKNDSQKVRSFYIWITDNIKYDLNAYLSGDHGSLEPEDVLRTKDAVCQGYSQLFKAMCDQAGIQAFLISGYSKGYGYRANNVITEPDHAWNIVNIDGRWELIDATWGSGYVNEKNKYVTRFNESFFLSNPETFIYTHLPEAPMWQLLDCPISLETFKKDSSQIKKTIATSEPCYSYEDSIARYIEIPDHEKQLYSAKKAYRFNPDNSISLGFAYLNHSQHYFNQAQDAQKQNNFKQFYQLLGRVLYHNEQALKFLRQSNSPNARQAISAARNNIKSAKDGRNWYEKNFK